NSSNMTRLVGYGTVRGDLAARPLIQASGITSFSLVTTGGPALIQNVAADAANLTSGICFNASASAAMFDLCKDLNGKSGNFLSNSSNTLYTRCESTGCSYANGAFF